ncbi:MAG: ROK family protein [Lachnospiraceae bacterium]|nr:ROK family protein [Lachnospiraceae bacterium]MDD3614895.1 ROK family protein [Lachnospiraceae bacterium]
MKYLAIDIGGTYTKYAVMDENCSFYEKDKIPTAQDNLESFINMLVDIYKAHAEDIEGIGISSAGMIDSETGFMYNGGSIPCISSINLVEILEKYCQVPVTVENDAKCAALAELWRGSLSDCTNAVAVICGTAVGGAVICDRKVMRGKNFMAGEFSYILTDSEDCMNSDKTLAMTNGVPALIRLVAQKKNISAKELDGEKVFSMANCGDHEVLNCIRIFARNLAVQLSNYQFILDPDRIAIGGGISAQPLFLQMIKEELKKLSSVFPYDVPIPDITNCKFFNDSNLIGALYVHLKAREEKIDVNKVKEFMDFLQDRREGQYLRELFIANNNLGGNKDETQI